MVGSVKLDSSERAVVESRLEEREEGRESGTKKKEIRKSPKKRGRRGGGALYCQQYVYTAVSSPGEQTKLGVNLKCAFSSQIPLQRVFPFLVPEKAAYEQEI